MENVAQRNPSEQAKFGVGWLKWFIAHQGIWKTQKKILNVLVDEMNIGEKNKPKNKPKEEATRRQNMSE